MSYRDRIFAKLFSDVQMADFIAHHHTRKYQIWLDLYRMFFNRKNNLEKRGRI